MLNSPASELGDSKPASLWTRLGRKEGGVDMTPMVDVTFLLLIFFMITAAFNLQKSLEIPQPASADAPSPIVSVEEKPEGVITIVIDQNGAYWVEAADREFEAPGKHELRRALQRICDEAPANQRPTKLLVKAHGDSRHERVVAALDVGVELGMEKVQLMTIEEDQ